MEEALTQTKALGIPEEMKRYCVKCRVEIDPKRVTRGSFFCGQNKDRCRNEDKKARRAYKASKDCALCGRKARKKPEPQKEKQIAESDVATGAGVSMEPLQAANSPIESRTMTEVLLEQGSEVSIEVSAPALGCDYHGYEFGADYPDSVCLDGYLWDADSGDASPDGDGWIYTSGGEIPCPKCNYAEWLEYRGVTDRESEVSEVNQ